MSAPKRDRRGVVVLSGVVLLIGVILSILVAAWVRETNLAEGRLLFERRTDRLTTEIHRRATIARYGLNGARGLYLASDKVSREDFRAYVDSRDLPTEFPGAIGFGFIERIARSDVGAYEAAQRASGVTDFTVHPVGTWDPCFIVKYVEPMDTNRAALGLDAGAETRRRAAIEHAVYTDEPTMSARLELVQDESRLAGFLYLVPVYKKGSNPQTPEERWEQLEGILYAPIVIERALSGIAQFSEGMLKFNIYDDQLDGESNLLFDFDNHDTTITGLARQLGYGAGQFQASRGLLVGSRVWILNITSSKRFDATVDLHSYWLIAIGGMVMSMLLASVVWAFGHSHIRALQLAVNMTRDLAEAKDLADAANQSKSEFLANMSHEIRTPLTAILGYAGILRDEGDIEKAPPKRVEAVNTILSGGEHLLQIINDILDLSKIEAGKVTIETIDTPIYQILVDIEGLMRPRAIGKGVKLSTEFKTPIPEEIIGDPTRIRQVLMNLVGNAVKFTDRGAVRVLVAAEERFGRQVLVVDIEDSGPGMTAEQIELLFRPFSQADGSVTRKHGGTGLGLTISHRLARNMGGDVVLTRSAPGRGSSFAFVIPLVQSRDAKLVETFVPTDRITSFDSDDYAEVPTRIPARILVAEDNPVNQKLIKFHLAKIGAEVTLAENGRVAMEKFLAAVQSDTPFHLLLTDMQMPEVDGYTLARMLRDRGESIPIIAITAHAMAEDRQKCIDAGCNDYVTKPIDRATLLKTCSRWFDRA